jgi:hypothetical protein
VRHFGRATGILGLLALQLAIPAQCQSISILPAPVITLPTPTDSNSPGHWSNGRFVVFNAMGTPYRSDGDDQYTLGNTTLVSFGPSQPMPLWIESTWVDDDGTLFAWYHHEPGGVCSDNYLTAPKIGALVSYDNGVSFQDLGIVLESGDPPACSARNGFFAGGNGDFTVVLDSSRSYFYFLYSNYGGDVPSQGVATARMAFSDRFNPVGTVRKYFKGSFSEPGLHGMVTPIFTAKVSWVDPDTDAFWGPSVHWNTALNKFVMLLNHSCCSPGWPQEGIYLSTSSDLSDPTTWSAPVRVLGAYGWYPQVIGEGIGETDKVAGAVARLYVGGWSWAELVISNDPPGPTDPDQDMLRARDPSAVPPTP